MNRAPRSLSFLWLGLVLAAVAWLVFVDARRVSAIRQWTAAAPAAAVDDASPTGYARETRNLLLPLNHAESQQWVIELQKMTVSGSWRAPRGDFDNAPEGRDLTLRAPYRWWLRLVASGERAVTSASAGRAVEQTVLHAGPILQVLLCLGGGLLVARRFGRAAGGLLAAGTSLWFALTQTFAPGRLEAHDLFVAVNFTGLLLLLCGLDAGASGKKSPGWFLAAGIVSGLGLWIDAPGQVVVLTAIALGFVASVLLLPAGKNQVWPQISWRAWGLGGAAVAAIGWFVEGRPSASGLTANHPLLWVAWLGLAETLTQLLAWRRGFERRSQQAALIVGLVVLVGAVGWRWLTPGGAETDSPEAAGFTSATTFVGWLREEKLGAKPLASLLVALSTIGAALWWARRSAPQRFLARTFSVGALLILLMAGGAVRWWDLVTVASLLLLVIVAASSDTSPRRNRWRVGCGLVLGTALVAGWPASNHPDELAAADAQALVERDLAQWLAARAELGAVVLAPPDLSGALCYYGGLRVIGSPYPGNDKGRAVAERLASVASPDEAQSMAQSRYLHYIVLPSWDDTLERAAAAANIQGPGKPLIALLRTWLPPRWLRPVPYPQPVVPGLEQTSLAVFEVVEPQENAVALSRLADYFVERGQLDLAGAVADSLASAFVGDVGGLIARAHVALARGDGRTLAAVMPELLPAIADGKDEDLSWERRAHLAIVLMQTRHPDLARAQVQFCLQEASEERLRQLGPVALFQLLKLAQVSSIHFAEPALQNYALGLLPPEFQAQLQP